MAHLFDKSALCRLNLLLRGVFLSQEDADAYAVVDAETRRSNVKSGRHKHFVERRCTRIFGPFLTVIDLNGEPICSRDGHPLGTGRRWYRPAQLDACPPNGESYAMPCVFEASVHSKLPLVQR